MIKYKNPDNLKIVQMSALLILKSSLKSFKKRIKAYINIYRV